MGIAAGAIGLLACACGGPQMQRHEVASHSYASTERCSQGPLEAEFTATGARWGESVEIYACGPRGVRASAAVEVDGVWANSGPVGFGERDNSRCVLRDAELAATGTDREPGVTADRGEPASGTTGGAAPAAVSTPSSARFREVFGAGELCRETMSTVLSLHTLDAGARIRVRIWSTEPNDLDGALIRIVHNSHAPNVSDEKWEKYVADQEAKWAKEDAERAARGEIDDDWDEPIVGEPVDVEPYTGPTTAPPAPRAEVIPPSPSTHAEWVSGYWYWNAEAWMWIDGQWRIPESDVSGGHLVSAPFAPPAVRAEDPTAPPTADAVWAAGYWAWDGQAYIWIAGTWRIPPATGSVWRAHTWRVTTGGVIFVPGGWGR